MKPNEVPAQFWEDAEKVLGAVISKGIILADVGGDNRIQPVEALDKSTPAVRFNGYNNPEGDDESYESFVLEFKEGEWNFCKTAREPYDLALKCILMLAEKYDLLEARDGDENPWSFDGNTSEKEYIEANNLMLELQLL